MNSRILNFILAQVSIKKNRGLEQEEGKDLLFREQEQWGLQEEDLSGGYEQEGSKRKSYKEQEQEEGIITWRTRTGGTE